MGGRQGLTWPRGLSGARSADLLRRPERPERFHGRVGCRLVVPRGTLVYMASDMRIRNVSTFARLALGARAKERGKTIAEYLDELVEETCTHDWRKRRRGLTSCRRCGAPWPIEEAAIAAFASR